MLILPDKIPHLIITMAYDGAASLRGASSSEVITFAECCCSDNKPEEMLTVRSVRSLYISPLVPHGNCAY